MSARDYSAELNRHYTPPNLGAAILEGLRRAGKDPERLQPADLAPVDHFHVRGKPATIELARLAQLQPGERVLDVGGGLGGPARALAAEFGARVTVLDLTEEYCRVGEMLTARTGQSASVTFCPGNALEPPFPAGSFDVAWMQHANMNIDDKERLYRELHRLLRPEGRLALQEIAAGAAQPIHFPVPWASDPALSFLRPLAQLRAVIEHSGFLELVMRDVSAQALAWFRERVASAPASPPPLGLHLLLGQSFRAAFGNMLRNLEEGRLVVFEAVYRRK